jgi:uncharacterized repeat protein (TIGR03943 family)
MLVRLAVTGDHQKYVRPGMGPYLVVAGALLVVLGLVATVQVLRAMTAPGHGVQGHGEPHGGVEGGVGHGHGHRPGHVGGPVSYLLVAPLIAVLVFAPPALGSFAVERSAVLPDPAGEFELFEPLTSQQPTAMSLFDFTERAYDRAGASFAGRPVRLTGFVHKERDGDGFVLARYQIACCAADALSTVVRVVGTGPPPARDSWVTVTGTFRAMTQDDVPELAATDLQPIAPPADPYE